MLILNGICHYVRKYPVLNKNICRDIKIKFLLHYGRYEVSQGSPGLNEWSVSRVFMGVENDWHSRHSVEMSGSSLFRHFCHVTKSEIGMKSFHRAFMGIKMTAQLTWVHFRSRWIVLMTSWSRYDVISKNCIRPFSIGNHVNKSTKRAK